MLIPVRDVQGRIVALLVRVDDATTGKYKYLSSKCKCGPSPGSPIHVPLFEGDKTRVHVTEGALKANLATQFSGILSIGNPGVSAWKRTTQALRELGAKVVCVSYDADCCKKRHVAEALYRLVDHLWQEDSRSNWNAGTRGTARD